MKEFFKDYKELCIDPVNLWYKKHWKGYLLVCAITWGGTFAWLCQDEIKEKIKDLKEKSQAKES